MGERIGEEIGQGEGQIRVWEGVGFINGLSNHSNCNHLARSNLLVWVKMNVC